MFAKRGSCSEQSFSTIFEFWECYAKFAVHHALSCEKGTFIPIRHNNIREVTAKLLKEYVKMLPWS